MDRPLHILYVTPAYKPAFRFGGPVHSVSAAAERLAARGHKVTVFATNTNQDVDLDVPLNQPLEVDGVEVWYFAHREPLKRYLGFFTYLSQSLGLLYAPDLRRALRERINGFDLVHTQLPFVYPTWAAAREAGRAGKALFYHQRGVFDPQRLKFRGFKKRLYIAAVERPILRQANTLIALTEAERQSYRALGVRTPCRVIPNGIEIRRYSQSPSPQFGLPVGQDQILLLFLGRLHPIKGADLLLEAFIRIGKLFPRAVLVMAGPDEHGLQARFQQRSLAEGLQGRILFPGMVSEQPKRDLLARADLFCLPSVGEGFSMAILEAMASATPAMISPGCHFDAVQQQGAGWVVERRVEAWAEGLGKALKQPDRLAALKEGALKLARSFDWDKIAEQLEDSYQEGLARKTAK